MSDYPDHFPPHAFNDIWEEDISGFVRHKPETNGVHRDPRTRLVYILTSESLEEGGLYVLRVTKRLFQEQDNKDLIFCSLEVFDEFYRHYPEQGYKLLGYGADGVVTKLAEPMRTSR